MKSSDRIKMRNMPQTIIADTLAIYKPEQRILISAEEDYPHYHGKFYIGPTYYTINPATHATDIEIQLCLNQLIYVAATDLIRSDKLPFLQNVDFSSMQHESMVIAESYKRFIRPIRTDKPIEGVISISRLRTLRNTLFCWADFQFEDRSCEGHLKLALVDLGSKR